MEIYWSTAKPAMGAGSLNPCTNLRGRCTTTPLCQEITPTVKVRGRLEAGVSDYVWSLDGVIAFSAPPTLFLTSLTATRLLCYVD